MSRFAEIWREVGIAREEHRQVCLDPSEVGALLWMLENYSDTLNYLFDFTNPLEAKAIIAEVLQGKKFIEPKETP